ncbi:hypothetical protein LOZ66_004678 [Ophidiomyces ophidiicola]|nr:hypothetical protein LOZ66_004678 [Ophidiomyces ophidiicola]
MSGRSSFQGAHAPSTASDEDESTYIQKTNTLQWFRIGLCGLIVILALTVIGTEGHALQYYNRTVQYEKVYLSLWPQYLDLRPTIALIVCGIILALQGMAFLAAALSPSPRSRIFFLNSLTTAVSAVGFFASLIAVTLSLVYTNPHSDNGTYEGETIHSWTCTWGIKDGRDARGEKIDPVKNFPRLCSETRASFALMCTLLLLQFALCISAGVGWKLEIGMKRKRNESALQSDKQSV